MGPRVQVRAWPAEGTVRLVRLESHGKESRVTTQSWHGGWGLGHREVCKPALKSWLVFKGWKAIVGSLQGSDMT